MVEVGPVNVALLDKSILVLKFKSGLKLEDVVAVVDIISAKSAISSIFVETFFYCNNFR